MSQLKIALLLALVVVFLCLSAADAARQLLDDFDNCHQGWCATQTTTAWAGRASQPFKS